MPQPIPPQPGQESVWDYPRPPRLEKVSKRIQIVFNGETIADTTAGYRVLETSHPPVYYLPPADIQMQYLQATTRGSFCEWKGNALYYHLSVGDRRLENVASDLHGLLEGSDQTDPERPGLSPEPSARRSRYGGSTPHPGTPYRGCASDPSNGG